MPGNQRSSGAVDDGEPLAAKRRDVQLVGDPRREADHLLDRRLVGDGDRDRAAHGEAEQSACAMRTDLRRRPRARRPRTTRGGATTSRGSGPPRTRAPEDAGRAVGRATRPMRSRCPPPRGAGLRSRRRRRSSLDCAGDADLRARSRASRIPIASATQPGSSRSSAGSIVCARCGDSRYVTSAPASSSVQRMRSTTPLHRDDRIERAVRDERTRERRVEVELEARHGRHEAAQGDESRRAVALGRARARTS